MPGPFGKAFGTISAKPPPAAAGMRIGLLGGSFNPPHDGHKIISRIALRQLQLDTVWWLVTPANPLKDMADVAPLQERMAACRRLAGDERRIVVTGFEQELATNYSISTLVFLRSRYPATRFVWLMGADNLAMMHHWKSWRELFHLMPIAVIDRPGWHLPAISSPAALRHARWRLPQVAATILPVSRPPAWTFLGGPLSDRSSTAIRQNEAGRPAQS